MKIQVIKKGNTGHKTMSICPYVVDVPPEASKS